MVNVELTDGIGEQEVNKIEIKNAYQYTMETLKRSREVHKNLNEENKKLVEQNMRLQEHFTLAEKYIEKLYGDIVDERDDKDVLETTMKSMDKRHKLAIANMVKSHEEALEIHLMGAQLDFDVHFPSRATWEEFVEEWKISTRLYFANTLVETNVAPTIGYDGNTNEEVEVEDKELTDP
ncbi:hypothetical protein J1N35_014934 [Gossypium stocksii]|uniref:Uncharacterized protein n=1 Tax=Gossypium stocksii TaxID=47602 RepID=A0A9D4A848_9ROSI|nr:hypothetical protein J1N35_014934 [Gossypium stocksii]